MNDLDLHKVLVSKDIWDLQYHDIDQFKSQVKAYLEKGYPGYVPVKASKGFVICRVEER